MELHEDINEMVSYYNEIGPTKGSKVYMIQKMRDLWQTYPVGFFMEQLLGENVVLERIYIKHQISSTIYGGKEWHKQKSINNSSMGSSDYIDTDRHRWYT